MIRFANQRKANKVAACSSDSLGVSRARTFMRVGFMRKVGQMVSGVTLMGLIFSQAAAAEPGEHIGTDTVQLIPSVQLFGHHRTNVYLQEGTIGGGEAATPGTSLIIHPSLSLKADGSDVLFELGAGYTARKYFQAEVTNLDRYKDFDIRTNLVLLRNAVVGLKINDHFHLNGFESEAEKADDPYIQLLRNSGSGRLTVRPGPSLELDMGGNFTYASYDTVSEASNNVRVGYGPAAEIKWKFLPKTALVGKWEMEWFNWDNNFIVPNGENTNGNYGSYLGIPNGRILRLEGGIRGRFTEKLVLGLVGGYGSAIYDEQSVIDAASTEGGSASTELDAGSQGFDADLKGLPAGLLGGVDISYTPVESQMLSLGYRKDFQDVFFTNYVAYNRVYLGYQGLFADRYGLSASANYRFEDYSGEVDRNDHRVVGSAGFRYVATKYLELSTGVTWRRRASADQTNADIEFDDVDIRFGATFTY
jgi:hypothetical protein